MAMRFLVPVLLGLMALPTALFAEDDDPIVRRLDVAPNRVILDAATHEEPVELLSSDDAAEFFGEDECAALDEQVDWDTQMVLVFAWRGSGQDRMVAEYDLDETDSVQFIYTPGRTRDLRPHVYVFVMPSDFFWGVETRGR